MLITQNTQSFVPARTLNQPGGESPKPNGDGPIQPDAIDITSNGATKGANFANGLMGAWNGAVVGAVGGAAVGLGGSILSSGLGALKGTSQITIGSLLQTMGTTGLWAAGGGIAGAAVGCFAAKGLGKVVGGFGASVATKLGGKPSVGRAVGTIATGVALGTIAGLSVAGYNGAAITLGAAALGGTVAYFKS